jgi:hypothetical protein
MRRSQGTAWIGAFDAVCEPSSLPSYLDPANAVNFRLDVLRAMASIPKSYRRALVHAMDGYDWWEIALLMGWARPAYREDGGPKGRFLGLSPESGTNN